jgi:DNA-binding MarR family transcriptional regulator
MTTTGPGNLAASLQRFGLARDQMRSVLARGAGISPADLDALEHLEADGPLTQRQLGDRLSLTSGAITMLVDRLEDGGWVRRRPHPTDRRYVLVELSAQAVERIPPSLAAYHDEVRAIAAEVAAKHRDAIADFLNATAEAASRAAAELRRQPSDDPPRR